MTNVIGPDGNVVKGYEYDEFGNTKNTGDADFKNDVTFTSSVGDMSSGLQYMNARFYQPSTGRFLTQDTYSGNPSAAAHNPANKPQNAVSGLLANTGFNVFLGVIAILALVAAGLFILR